ncbi:multiple epidermal growth factor-like domains protein 10 [Saccostrea echinata]|uniref:multiple epidermal growth factor-like domains protein 10 n=1 Tax=Saccostrea echinata TaxID=191078 RepID=UPI002A82798D|nr:multiple epidermal growth factor-like domains protein 10 [Saccostrea echinata]
MSKCEECECKPGYTGSNCEKTCPYAGYGEYCQETCNCKKQYCNHITGCSDGSPTISPPSTTLQHTLPTVEIYNNACLPGYLGHNCELQCRYPSFGVNCQEHCDCKEESCNTITGCGEPDRGCSLNENKKRREYLLYGSVILGAVAVLQFSVYFYLSFFYKPVVFIINHL